MTKACFEKLIPLKRAADAVRVSNSHKIMGLGTLLLCSDRALSHPQAKSPKRERQQASVLSNSGKSEHMLDGDREKRSSVLFQDGESDAQRHGARK